MTFRGGSKLSLPFYQLLLELSAAAPLLLLVLW